MKIIITTNNWESMNLFFYILLWLWNWQVLFSASCYYRVHEYYALAKQLLALFLLIYVVRLWRRGREYTCGTTTKLLDRNMLSSTSLIEFLCTIPKWFCREYLFFHEQCANILSVCHCWLVRRRYNTARCKQMYV